MKISPVVLLLCVWAAHAHTSSLGVQAIEKSSASVRLGTARSPGAPLLLEVEAFGERHSLHLQPAATPFAKDFRLQITSRDEEGDVIIQDVAQDQDDDSSELYEDPKAGSVVQLRPAGIEGLISPTLSLTTTDDGQHEALRLNYETPAEHHINDYLQVPEEARIQYEPAAASRAKTSATVELYVVVDSALTAKHGSITEVKNYLRTFWSVVNQRFAGITDPKIKLVLAGSLIISDSSNEPSFITDSFISQNVIDGYKLVKSLTTWKFEQKDSLPSHDVTYFMTGRDLASVFNNEIDTDLQGIAYMKSACLVMPAIKRAFSVSTGEASTAYSGVETAAHELAHNLGVEHDGSWKASSCPYSEGFIMGYSRNYRNQFLFSSCSKRQMKQYLSTEAANCLYTDTATSQIPLSSLPGENISLDQQCKKATGEKDAYVSRYKSDNELCSRLVCQYVKRKGNFYSYMMIDTERPALEGSPCKNGGKCINGSCQ